MKIRRNFVANSSTTSFVLIGIRTDDLEGVFKKAIGKDVEEWVADGELAYWEFEDEIKETLGVVVCGGEYVGNLLSSSSSDEGYLPTMSLSSDEIKSTFKQVAKALKLKESDLSLFIGEYAS